MVFLLFLVLYYLRLEEHAYLKNFDLCSGAIYRKLFLIYHQSFFRNIFSLNAFDQTRKKFLGHIWRHYDLFVAMFWGLQRC